MICAAKLKNGNACKRTCKNNTPFCVGHYNKDIITEINRIKIYMNIQKNTKIRNDKLDDLYAHNLLGLYESFAEVPVHDQIKMDGEYFVLSILVSHFTEQLNSSMYEHSYPIYPSNPFTRCLFSPDAINHMKIMIDKQSLAVPDVLKAFLHSGNKINMCYSEAIKKDDRSCKSLISYMNYTNHVYHMTNVKNSQNLYTGMWTNKKEKTLFEELYAYYKKIPPLINLHGHERENPDKIEFKMILDKYY